MAVWCRKQKGKTTNICVLEQMSGESGGGDLHVQPISEFILSGKQLTGSQISCLDVTSGTPGGCKIQSTRI